MKKSIQSQPIRVPLIRFNGITSSPDTTENQIIESVTKSDKRDIIDDNGSKFLSIPRLKVQTPPLSNLRYRSKSFSSTEGIKLFNPEMLFHNTKRPNEEMITLSSRHLYSHNLLRNNESEMIMVKNSFKKGHECFDRENPDGFVIRKTQSVKFNFDNNRALQQQSQPNHCHVSGTIRPSTPFRRASVTSGLGIELKEIFED